MVNVHVQLNWVFILQFWYHFYTCSRTLRHLFTLSWIHIMWFLPLFSRTFLRSLQRITPLPWMSIPLLGGWGWWTRTISPTLCQPQVGGAQPCCLLMVGPILPPSLCSLSLSLSLSLSPQSFTHISLTQSSLSLFSLSLPVSFCLSLFLPSNILNADISLWIKSHNRDDELSNFDFSFEDSKNISQ